MRTKNYVARLSILTAVAALLMMLPGGVNAASPDFGLYGYAKVSGSTTGGTGGTTYNVSTLSALKSYASGSTKAIIIVTGTINGSGSDTVTVASNKTIVGKGSAGVLNGVSLVLKSGVSNIVIRNLKITKCKASNDNIHLERSVHHVWIDHCDLSSDTTHDKDYYDGLLDITHAADYITVSWNYFHDHYKTSLVGHSDDNSSEDSGHLHVTYHHNYYKNISSRAPSIRFGTLHAYNNYYKSFFDAGTGISSRMGAVARIEKDYFDTVGTPIMTDQSDTKGYIQLVGNKFVNCGSYATSPIKSLSVPYSYTANAVADVPSLVSSYAGIGKVSNPQTW